MLNFDYYSPTRLVYGPDSHKQIGVLIKPMANRALLHYGSARMKNSEAYADVVNALLEAGVAFIELGGVVPNPKLSLVHEGIEICRRERIDLVVGLGGGSVIDSAKAIAMGALHDGDIWTDFYKHRRPLTKALPVAAVLTIPAAGSETGGNSVITNEVTKDKQGYSSTLLCPKISVVNPQLFISLPKNQLGYGTADMMSHIFECYFTNTMQTRLIDNLDEATLRVIMQSASILAKRADDVDAWYQLGLSSTLANNGLLNLGRQRDGSCHAMCKELSGAKDVIHGAGLAVLTPAWMRYVYPANVGLFTQFAVKVMGVDGSFREPETIVLEGIERLEAFYKTLGLPVALSEVGVVAEDIENAAKALASDGGVGSVKKLNYEDMMTIYESVL